MRYTNPHLLFFTFWTADPIVYIYGNANFYAFVRPSARPSVTQNGPIYSSKHQNVQKRSLTCPVTLLTLNCSLGIHQVHLSGSASPACCKQGVLGEIFGKGHSLHRLWLLCSTLGEDCMSVAVPSSGLKNMGPVHHS